MVESSHQNLTEWNAKFCQTVQAYLGGYATNINNIQSLFGWDIQQT